MRTNCGSHASYTIAFLLAVLLILPAATNAVETDQFLTWDIELKDSAGPLNRFFNDELRTILETRNSAIEQTCDCANLAEGIFRHFFKKRRLSILKEFLRNSDEVEMYPDFSVSNSRYRSLSIYRNLSFPYVIPMARTIRVGDVYLGIDKLGHMFGFGSRYYSRYVRLTRFGYSEEDAVKRIVRYGILFERIFVGEYLDGVFAYADLEANYQGFLLSRDLCEGDAPYLVLTENKWQLTRPIDLRRYITPGFDESYNLPHWWGSRKGQVLAILREEYSDKLRSSNVQRRFDGYRTCPPSVSQEIVDAYFLKKGEHPQISQSYLAFDAPPYGGKPLPPDQP